LQAKEERVLQSGTRQQYMWFLVLFAALDGGSRCGVLTGKSEVVLDLYFYTAQPRLQHLTFKDTCTPIDQQ